MPNENDSDKKPVGKEKEQPEETPVEAPVDSAISKIVEKIETVDSVLVALSRDPSVDEIAAAIGLTLSLDKIGKHVTAIYSGKTPNALQFLEPEKTFEDNTNSLQDFIIALDKDKADHLRYKIEGDFVKVYITPYKTTISEKDLEFSHGDVNVDMVISLNVVATEDLDAALQEHGRIMHDAISVNISNGVPGRLGGIEWNDARASSVSEMVLKLVMADKVELSKDIATALLTGIVAATDRFSNDKTSPETMAASAELMKYGADQQLIVSHMDDISKVEPEDKNEETEKPVEPGSIDVSHEDENEGELDVKKDEEADKPESESSSVMSPEQELEKMIAGQSAQSGPIMEELKKAGEEQGSKEESKDDFGKNEGFLDVNPPSGDEPASMPEVAAPSMSEMAGPSVPETPVSGVMEEPKVELESTAMEPQNIEPQVEGVAAVPVPQVNTPIANAYATENDMTEISDHTMTPPEEEKPKDYGAMMEEALAEPMNNPMMNPAIGAAPAVPENPEVQPEQNVADMVNQMVNQSQLMPGVEVSGGTADGMPAGTITSGETEAQPAMPTEVAITPSMNMPASDVSAAPMGMAQNVNPAIMAAPVAPAQPEVQPVPQPMVAAAPELPPPPVPPAADFSAMPPVPSLPPVQPTMSAQPPMPEQMQMTGQMQMPEQMQTAPAMAQDMNGMSMTNPAVAASPVPSTTPEVPVDAAVPTAALAAAPVEAQDNSAANGIPEAPAGAVQPPEPVNPVIVQPVQDPTKVQPVQDPGAFKIPGM